MKIKKVVIIGGTGFIGSYLTNKILKRKNIDLTIIYRTTKPDKDLSHIHYLQIDGSEEEKKIEKVLKNTDILLILTQPNEKLIKNIIKHGETLKKIIYTSTMLLYADTDAQHKEDSLIKPLTEYEQNKFKEEISLIRFSKKHKIKLCIARLSNVYGDIQNRGIIQKIFDSVLNHSKFILNGDGNQKRDYIYVNDVAKLLEFLTFYNQKRMIDIFNLCSGKGYVINDLINLIEKISNNKILIQKTPPIIEKKYMIGNNLKIMHLVNNFMFTSLKSGLRKTYERNLEAFG